MVRRLILIAAATAFVPTAATASDAPKARAKVLQAAIDCAAIKGDAERLACYDRAVPALAKAEADSQIVVTDREQMRENRRSLFGFRLPALRIFGGGKDDGELGKVDTTIASVSRSYDGHLALTVADGARWVQTDDRAIVGKIAPGTKVTISRGAMGSYFASIPGRPGFKVERRN